MNQGVGGAMDTNLNSAIEIYSQDYNNIEKLLLNINISGQLKTIPAKFTRSGRIPNLYLQNNDRFIIAKCVYFYYCEPPIFHDRLCMIMILMLFLIEDNFFKDTFY